MNTQVACPSFKSIEEIWDDFLYFECEQMAAKFLHETYDQKQLANPKATAFQAAPKLSYAIRQAREYYLAAKDAHLLIKPLLCFYGMSCLARALIVRNNPDYPTGSSVLKHGLSTRKMKRIGYQLADDQIVIQKDGLYVVFHKLIHFTDQIPISKYRIADLLGLIPELIKSLSQIGIQASIAELQIETYGSYSIWSLSRASLQEKGFSCEDWLNFLNQPGDETFVFLQEPDPPGLLKVKCNSRKVDHPALCRDLNGKWFARLPAEKNSILREICAHYMIMFILGMLCRYETEYWGEIVLGGYSSDAYIIQKFLSLSYLKFPQMILAGLTSD